MLAKGEGIKGSGVECFTVARRHPSCVYSTECANCGHGYI